MDGFLIKLTNCLREVVLGPDTQKIRDQYFTNAEKTIRQNSYFNWFSSRIAIWKLRKSRTRMDQMWSLLLDPNFHKAVSEYVSQLEPVIEKIVEREIGDTLVDLQEKWENMDSLDIKEMFTRSKNVARS